MFVDILLSLLKSKTAIAVGGTTVAAGIATPVVLTVQGNDSRVLSQNSFDSYFSTVSLNKLVDFAKSNPQTQRETQKVGQLQIPTETDIKNFQDALQNINNYDVNNKEALTREQRKALSDFFLLYIELERSKSPATPGSSLPNRDSSTSSHPSDSPLFLDRLFDLSWNQEQVKLIKDSSGENGKWGWSTWDDKNPFWLVYGKDEAKWKSKMEKLGTDSSNLNAEVTKEIEYDIASWVLKDIVRIHKAYMN